ncbi:MAG: cytochrome c biogenesis CcdA family protein [Chloroflexi bacterium]|nr:cytochrome c biogenesis CcdA family protein [Chloroflexota bacterium]
METQATSIMIAFGAGILSVASPCVLPLVPIYLAHLVGSSSGLDGSPAADRRTPMLHALSFVAGFTVIFVTLGVSAGLLGVFAGQYKPYLEKFAGAMLILLGLHTARLLVIPFLDVERRVHLTAEKTGYARSFVIGSAFAAGWVPCVGPILGAILAMAAANATAVEGGVLLTAYSLGLGLPFLAAGLAMGPATTFFRKMYRFMPAISMGSGALLVVVGVLIFTNRLVLLNQYFDFWGLSSI